MKTEKLKLGRSCHLEVTSYDIGPLGPDVSLEYVENASDHWSSDTTTNITIDADMARKIIAFLKVAHGITGEG